MARKVLIVLFTLGVVGGYGAAVAHVAGHRCWHRADWQARVADVCVRAADRARVMQGAGHQSANPAPTPPPSGTP
jgi:hypothetical protein